MLGSVLRMILKGVATRAPAPQREELIEQEADAAEDSTRYIAEHMQGARDLIQRGPLLESALSRCSIEGLLLEFGVYRGASLRFIAERVNQPVHGFDSFEGLPADWTHFQRKGRFSLGGKAPQLDMPEVQLHAGLFSDSLPLFLNTHAGPARFVHIDCDLYSSTKDVLSCLGPRIVPGTVIVFDEYLNYPGWRDHEYLAFKEFIAASPCTYRYLGFASAQCSVAVQIIAPDSSKG